MIDAVVPVICRMDDWACGTTLWCDGEGVGSYYHKMTRSMPAGGRNRVEIAVASILALLAMKGSALRGRQKRKDAYDVYCCVRNYPGGPEALAKDCQPILATEEGATGYGVIKEKFESVDMIGPIFLRQFVEESQILGDRTADQWQQDAFGKVNAWVKAVGL